MASNTYHHRRGRRSASSDYPYWDDYFDDERRPRHVSRTRTRGGEAASRLGAAIGLGGARSRRPSPARGRRNHSPPARYHSPERHYQRRSYSVSPSRQHDRHHDGQRASKSRWVHGAEAAAEAGAIEAIRLRREPGSWSGVKGRRVMTAAVSAGAIGAASEGKVRPNSGRGKTMGVLGSSMGGLLVNRLLNGSRHDQLR